MEPTRSFRETVVQRVQKDPKFRIALMEEAFQNVVDGDLTIALGQIRDLVTATIGFDALAAETSILKPSLMRMLSSEGNPRSGNLLAIMRALVRHVGVHLTVRAKPAVTPDAVEDALLGKATLGVSTQTYAQFLARLDDAAGPNDRLRRTMRVATPWT